MARNPQIRITKADKKEYQRLAKNTRAKLKRTLENYNVDLSGEINIPPLMSFETRAEFNKWKNEQTRFTNVGNLKYQFVKNKYGTVATKQEILKVQMDTRNAQRIAKELQDKFKDLPFKVGGQEVTTMEQRMLQVARPNIAGIYVPSDFDFNKMSDRRYFESRMLSMEKRANPNLLDERMVKMQENFIESLFISFNSDADTLTLEILKLSPLEFFELYMTNDEFDFNVFYNDEFSDDFTGANDSQIEKMLSIVKKFKPSPLSKL